MERCIQVIMTTILTKTGWFGLSSGAWSGSANTVKDTNGGVFAAFGEVIDMQGGNDKIEGTGITDMDSSGNTAGITMDQCTVNTGAGNDSISGTSGSDGDGISIGGATINMGSGNDKITGTSKGRYGTALNISGSVDTGTGNDTLTGTSNGGDGINNSGTILTGDGIDIITGSTNRNSEYNAGLSNYGQINTGSGDDVITGKSKAGGQGKGIINTGTIKTEAGNDTVDALNGGFDSDPYRGTGLFDLGSDNDTVKGFGRGFFDGGSGTDRLLFNAGTYNIAATGGGFLISTGGKFMNTYGFENVGSASNETTLGLKAGTLQITSAGGVSYL
jgi:hypothetical protein